MNLNEEFKYINPGMVKYIYNIITFLTISIGSISCWQNTKNSNHLGAVIKTAGENGIELSKVIDHYSKNSDDNSKLQAATFLLEGLPGLINYDSNYLIKFDTVLKRSHEVVQKLEATGLSWKDRLKYQYYDSMTRTVKHWEKNNNIYSPGNYKQDLENITANYLIQNIELAFYARENYPWTRNLSFTDFCEFVLPHSFEPGSLNNWRSKLHNRYTPLLKMHLQQSEEENTKPLINDILNSMGQLYFTTSLNPYINYLDFDRTLAAKATTCLAKAKANIQALRSIGIPTTIDFYQFPSNQSSAMGHEWNVIVNGDSTLSFDPFWRSVDSVYTNGSGEKHSHNNKYRTLKVIRVSKIFRQHYSIQEASKELFINCKGDVPEYFKNLKMSDVSKIYLDVADVSIKVDPKLKYVYICNFAIQHEWKPVYWAKVEDGIATFKDMGKDIAYMVMAYENGTLRQLSEPFILTQEGQIKWTGISKTKTTLVLNELRFNHAEDNDTSTSLGKFDDKNFQLYYWANNRWTYVGTKQFVSHSLTFNNVPEGKIYLLKNPDAEGRERIFTYENGKQIWW